MELTTPALLFPAISLLMLAYTNRFLTLAQLVRELHARYKQETNQLIAGQIENLRRRLVIIKYMQLFGALSLLFCVVAMFLIFAGKENLINVVFGSSLILLLISLALLIVELYISIDAINLQLKDFEEDPPK